MNDVPTVQGARLRSLETESMSYQLQGTGKAASFKDARAAAAQLQVSMDAFPQSIRAVMDVSIWELKESMVAIESDALTDVDGCQRELEPVTATLRRVGAPPRVQL